MQDQLYGNTSELQERLLAVEAREAALEALLKQHVSYEANRRKEQNTYGTPVRLLPPHMSHDVPVLALSLSLTSTVLCWQGSLKQQLRFARGDELLEDAPVACAHCAKVFASVSYLDKHIGRRHPGMCSAVEGGSTELPPPPPPPPPITRPALPRNACAAAPSHAASIVRHMSEHDGGASSKAAPAPGATPPHPTAPSTPPSTTPPAEAAAATALDVVPSLREV